MEYYNNALIISTSTELLRFSLPGVLYIMADGNYAYIYMVGGWSKQVTMQLGQIATLIGEQAPEYARNFSRVGKGLIVNLNHLYYINPGRQELTINDPRGERTTLSASKDALKTLKDIVDHQIAQH